MYIGLKMIYRSVINELFEVQFSNKFHVKVDAFLYDNIKMKMHDVRRLKNYSNVNCKIEILS